MAYLDLATQVRLMSRSVLKQVLGRERLKWGMGDYVSHGTKPADVPASKDVQGPVGSACAREGQR